MAKPGATVMIVFHLLYSRHRQQDWFTANQIQQWYEEELKCGKGRNRVKDLLNCFKKRQDKSPLWAFQDSKKLNSWLRMHVDRKPRYWFEFDGRHFRFKKKFIDELKGWLAGCPETVNP